jgi:hypothetical protein
VNPRHLLPKTADAHFRVAAYFGHFSVHLGRGYGLKQCLPARSTTSKMRITTPLPPARVTALEMCMADISLAGSQRRSTRAFWLGALLNAPAVFAYVIASSTNTKGAVACESKFCSGIGIELLKRGVSFSFGLGRVRIFFVGKGVGWAGLIM